MPAKSPHWYAFRYGIGLLMGVLLIVFCVFMALQYVLAPTQSDPNAGVRSTAIPTTDVQLREQAIE